ncbi:hypothetical protein K2X96_00880 [Patescibacteria group bacterium]|jgi:hypothetical protein|nr:hypothetical protein [Patescibacteria group bacterium]
MITLYTALTLGTIGKLILGIAVLRVHAYIIKEHRIDDVVLRAMKRERYITVGGVILILIGYAMEIYFYANVPLVL